MKVKFTIALSIEREKAPVEQEGTQGGEHSALYSQVESHSVGFAPNTDLTVEAHTI